MQATQTTLDFTNYNHRENNVESQENFDKNKPRFSKQCQIVFDALSRGEKLTTTTALLNYGIGHLPRRILDLKEIGINIQSALIENRFKEYFLAND